MGLTVLFIINKKKKKRIILNPKMIYFDKDAMWPLLFYLICARSAIVLFSFCIFFNVEVSFVCVCFFHSDKKQTDTV